MRAPPLRIDPQRLNAAIGLGAAAPLADRVFATLSDAIARSRYRSEARLPSVRELASSCGVSRDTVVRAYEKLVAHGLAEARRGSGYYVRPKGRQRPKAPDPQSLRELELRRLGFLSRHLQVIRPGPHALSVSGTGTLPAAWFEHSGLRDALKRLGRQPPGAWAEYSDPQGYLPLRQQLSEKVAHFAAPVRPQDIIVTAGATDALRLVIQCFAGGPGSAIAIEDPTHPLMLHHLMSEGIDCQLVPRLRDGPDLDALRTVCATHRPRFFFCSSTLHNPTSSSISRKKALALVRLAKEYGMVIVEDDTYGDLANDGVAAGGYRLAEVADLERFIYIGSFSKTLAPSLRCGFVAASAERIEWLSIFRLISSIGGALINERAVSAVLQDGGYRRHCLQLQDRLAHARAPLVSRLRSLGLRVAHAPEAGMYVWAALPDNLNATAIAAALMAQGHILAPGQMFSPQPEFASCLRFNVGHGIAAQLAGALERAISRR